MQSSSVLTIDSPVQEKLQKARSLFLEERRFSPSRLDAWIYAFGTSFHSKQPTKEELLNVLLRLDTIEPENMRKIEKGWRFENAVSEAMGKKMLNPLEIDDDDRYNASLVMEYFSELEKEHISDLSYASQQIHVETMLYGYYLHGYVDCKWENKMFDFKYTERCYDDIRYEDKLQHKLYLLCLEEEVRDIFTFEYLILDHSKKNSLPELFIESYRWQDEYIADILDVIRDISIFLLQDDEAFDKKNTYFLLDN